MSQSLSLSLPHTPSCPVFLLGTPPCILQSSWSFPVMLRPKHTTMHALARLSAILALCHAWGQRPLKFAMINWRLTPSGCICRQTAAQTQMDVNFSSHVRRQTGWMGSMSCLAESLGKDYWSCARLKMSQQQTPTSQSSSVWLQNVVKCDHAVIFSNLFSCHRLKSVCLLPRKIACVAPECVQPIFTLVNVTCQMELHRYAGRKEGNSTQARNH